jgi:hypothetical protein
MVKDTNPLVTGIVATVVGSLIVALVLWLIPDVWLWIVKTAGFSWRWLKYSVSLPVSVLALALVCALWTGWWLARRQQSSSGAPSAQAPALTDLERGVIQLLVNADGRGIDGARIPFALGSTNLLVQQALAHLYSYGLLNNIGPLVALSSEGIDYAMREGFVPKYGEGAKPVL